MPTPFGKYQLQRKLAEGGMAEVFLAKQGGALGFEKLVVIKRILPQLLKEQEFVKMFINEARLAARLNHGNIVQIFDLGKIDGLYFIAMEFIHGEDIRSIVVECNHAATRPPAGIICRILADTLGGLHYAHTRVGPDGKPLGLVHRDVSPQNVLATYEGSVKLVDFGIAKATRATSEQTRAGLFKGKFSYMAPEQTRGATLDARADVFAVGILLWELLTWRRLFKKATEMATLIAVSEEKVTPPRQIRPELPAELDRIVMRALARPLEERYPTAQDMRADLEALIRDEGWEADSLSIERFMRETFQAKLKAQEADIRAAGLASLDDFLLTVDEGTKMTWLKEANQRTPSGGLPTPTSEKEAAEQGALASSRELPLGDAPPGPPLPGMRPVVGGGSASSSGITAVDGPSAIPKPTPPPPLTAPSAPPSSQPTLRSAQGPSGGAPVLSGSSPAASAPSAPAERAHSSPSSGMNAAASGPRLSPSIGPPAVVVSTMPPAPPTMPSVGEAWTAAAPTDPGQTSRQPSYDPSPARLRRIIVISLAAALATGVTLTVILWPSPSSTQPPIATPLPVVTQLPSPSPDPVPAPAPPSGPVPTLATLEINLDKDAVIAIDGTPEPLGHHATVQVKPGMIHKVTVQRPGHSQHKYNVAAPAAGEHLSVTLKVP